MTNFENLFGAKKPIIQAPMAGIQDSQLAIAVSNAGGVGSLPAAMLNHDELEKEIAHIQSQTHQPFNINFFCHPTPEKNQQKEAHWQRILSPYYEEYDLKKEQYKPIDKQQRSAFNPEIASLLRKYKPPIVSFHFGLPAAALIADLKSFGTTILSTATTVEEAIWLVAHGADAIIAQGLQAGGHRGHFLSDDLTKQDDTFVLLNKILKAVHCPIIAAGGISDKESVQKALSLGAIGVQVGTAYLLCEEAQTKALHQKAIKMTKRPTEITNLFSGRPARGIVNRLIKELGPMHDDVPMFPLASAFLTTIRELAEAKGLDDFSPLWCGENRKNCQALPASEITKILTEGI